MDTFMENYICNNLYIIPVAKTKGGYASTSTISPYNEPVSIRKNDSSITYPLHKYNPNSFFVYDVLCAIGIATIISLSGKSSIYLGGKLYKYLTNNPISNYFKNTRIGAITDYMNITFNNIPDSFIVKLPKEGMSSENIINTHAKYVDTRPKHSIINTTDDITYIALIGHIYNTSMYSSMKHPLMFPDTVVMELEIINIIKQLLNAPENSCGNMTHSHNESNILACYAYSQKALHYKNITSPEMIISETAHISFHTAATLFNIKLIIIKNDPYTGKIMTSKVIEAISNNTICIIGSAPSYCYGIIDDIMELSDIAVGNDIDLHIDYNVDGFYLQFLTTNGIVISQSDFKLNGVSSITINIPHHNTNTGTILSSAIIYRQPSLRKYQYFITDKWAGGIHASPTLIGDVPGSIIATTWANLLYNGQSSYIRYAVALVDLKNTLISKLRQFEDIVIIGEPCLSTISFKSITIPIHTLVEKMFDLGWNLNILTNPTALNMSLLWFYNSNRSINTFITNLGDTITDLEPVLLSGANQPNLSTSIHGNPFPVLNINDHVSTGIAYIESTKLQFETN